MTEQQARANGITAIAAGLLQIFTTYQALVVPAVEYDPAFMVWLSLALDAGIAVGLAAICLQFLQAPAGTPWRAAAIPMAAIATILSVVQIAIRFTSDHAWWTGHLNYTLG